MMMNINFSKVLIAVSFLFSLSAYAQPQVYPVPQHMQVQKQKLITKQFFITSSFSIWENELSVLKKILPTAKSGTPIAINKSNNLSNLEAYNININAKGVIIEANTNVALFYALQTLQQLVVNDKNNNIVLPYCTINDFPDVAFRGVVEGYYGKPYSYADRVSHFEFYGKIKANTYIYGPKDDPYHSSPNWRSAYPDSMATQLKQLITIAHQNHVNFTWAIHPGKDIKWNLQDSLAVIKKLDIMYQLGIRSFAFFFDDISGAGTAAEKQAGLLNYVNKEFVEKKGDVLPLLLCPTEYNKSWSNSKPGSYLDVLGDKLHSSINVMWTGDRVAADIDTATMKYINTRLKRNAFIWWNYPVNDYTRNHMLVGGTYGNGNNISSLLSGFVSNPMEHAEASKIGIFGVADYLWNMKAYHHTTSHAAAVALMVPKATQAFQLFCDNNADLGENYHGYRRKESVYILPQINEVLQQLKQNKINTPTYKKVNSYFAQIQNAPASIFAASTNKKLIEELKPWLLQFQQLGLLGNTVLSGYAVNASSTLANNWNNYARALQIVDSIKIIDKSYNQNPWQPGIVTGSLVLKPFVDTVTNIWYKQLLLQAGVTNSNNTTALSAEKILTNIQQLKQQPVKVNDKEILISPLLEVVKLQPNEYVGLQWLGNKKVQNVSFNFDIEKWKNWGQLQYSTDGDSWSNLSFDKEDKKGNIDLKNTKALYVRFINTSNTEQAIYLKEFKVKTQAADASSDKRLLTDKNFNTGIELAANQTIDVQTNEAVKTLFINSYKQNVVISYNNQVLYTGNSNYIQLPKTINNFTIKNMGKKAIKLYEAL